MMMAAEFCLIILLLCGVSHLTTSQYALSSGSPGGCYIQIPSTETYPDEHFFTVKEDGLGKPPFLNRFSHSIMYPFPLSYLSLYAHTYVRKRVRKNLSIYLSACHWW